MRFCSTFHVQNVSVYFRPRYLKFRDRDNEEWRLSSALRSLDLPVPSILTSEWWRTLRSSRNDNDDSSRGPDDRVFRKDASDAKTVIVMNSNKYRPNTNITTTEE